MAKAYCHSWFNCELGSIDAVAMTAVMGSPGRCAEWTARRIARRWPWLALEQAEARGTLQIDVDGATACVTLHWDHCLSRTETLETSACRDAFAGSVPVGDSCFVDAECSGDAYCHFPFHDGIYEPNSQCPGECRPRLQPGDACRSPRMCSVSQGQLATCMDTEGGTSVCGEVSILRPAGVGERCGYITGDNRYTTCLGGQCDGLSNVVVGPGQPLENAGTCMAFTPAGGACNRISCVPGTMCPWSQAGGGTCQRLKLTRSLGAACGDLDETDMFCDLDAGVYCAENNTCQLLGDGSVGSRCDSALWPIFESCNQGLFCNEGTCRERVPAGASCASQEECDSGQCRYSDDGSGLGVCDVDYCDPWGD